MTRRELSDEERAQLRAAGAAAMREACRKARVPLKISDPVILLKAAALLARYDDEVDT